MAFATPDLIKTAYLFPQMLDKPSGFLQKFRGELAEDWEFKSPALLFFVRWVLHLATGECCHAAQQRSIISPLSAPAIF